MGIEFKVLKELATVSATAAELAGVNHILCEEIRPGSFHEDYRSLLSDIVNTYRVVINILRPLSQIDNSGLFCETFSTQFQHYSQSYQSALSEPRVNAEYTFQKYLQFRKRPELATSYPVLKKTFSRLHDYIDKWIDNDIWLAMSIDGLLKMLYRVLDEVNQLTVKDHDAAFSLYVSCVGNFKPYLYIIDSSMNAIEKSMPDVRIAVGE